MGTTAKSKSRLRRERLEGMQRVADAKLAELQRLQHERERLEVRHATVTALAEAFAVLRDWEAQEEAAAAAVSPTGSAASARVSSASEEGDSSTLRSPSSVRRATSDEEAQLLSQLERLPLSLSSGNGSSAGSGSCAGGGCAGSDDDPGDAGDEPRPIAPADDPLLLIRELRGRPPGIDGLTLARLQEMNGAAVREMALQLQLLESGAWQRCGGSGGGGGGGGNGGGGGGPAAAAAAAAAALPRERLRLLVWDQLRVLAALSTRVELVADFQLTNALTGERLQQPDEEQHRWALAQVRLSPTQLRRIAAGAGVLRELHGRILAQLRAAQAECAAAAAASEAAAVERGGGRALEEHLGQLERQDSSRAHVEALLRKEWRFRVSTSAFFFGCLSYKQVAKLFVLFWPVYFVPYLLLRLVEEQHQQEMQQQEQHQQEQQQQASGDAIAGADATSGAR